MLSKSRSREKPMSKVQIQTLEEYLDWWLNCEDPSDGSFDVSREDKRFLKRAEDELTAEGKTLGPLHHEDEIIQRAIQIRDQEKQS